MAEHMQDEEQLEAIKQWWQENKVSVIAAFVVAVGGTLGWSQYTDYSASKAAAAANSYDAVVEQKNQLGTDGLAELVGELREEHAGSVYSGLASMQLASVAVGEGNYELAIEELTQVVSDLDPASTMGQMAQSASLDMGRGPGLLELKVTALELRLGQADVADGALQ